MVMDDALQVWSPGLDLVFRFDAQLLAANKRILAGLLRSLRKYRVRPDRHETKPGELLEWAVERVVRALVCLG